MTNFKSPPCIYCKDENHSVINCPKRIEDSNNSAKIRKEWYNNHKCCPNCNSKHINQTLVGAIHISGEPFEDNVNNATCCKCNWKGKVKDLIPEIKNYI